MHAPPTPSPTPPFTVSNYNLHSFVAAGNSGLVYTATQNHHPQQHGNPNVLPVTGVMSSSTRPRPRTPALAIKIIPCDKLSRSSLALSLARREIGIHHSLNHPNIAALHEVTTAMPVTSSPSSTPALALVLDYASQGDLFTQVSSAGSLPSAVVRKRLFEIASALSHMHDNGLVHLDVKLENVVLTKHSVAKLIDFGCARHVDSSHPWHSAHTSLGGTLHYLSPEAVIANSSKTNDDGDDDVVDDDYLKPTPAMDAWALGVLTYTALVGNYPFSYNGDTTNPSLIDVPQHQHQPVVDDDTMASIVLHQIVHDAPHPIPSSLDVPHDLQALVFGLLEKDADKRLTVAKVVQALQHTMVSSASRRRLYASARRGPAMSRGTAGDGNGMMMMMAPTRYARMSRTRTPSPSCPADADFGTSNRSTVVGSDNNNNNNNNDAMMITRQQQPETMRKQTANEVQAVIDSVVAAKKAHLDRKRAFSKNNSVNMNVFDNGMKQSKHMRDSQGGDVDDDGKPKFPRFSTVLSNCSMASHEASYHELSPRA